MSRQLILTLLTRGDNIAIEHGRLTIQPASGSPVPKKWLEENEISIVTEIAQTVDIVIFSYIDYSTGNYRKQGGGQGLTLQLLNMVDESEAYAIFNCDLTRLRSTKFGKKNDALPYGQFRPTRGSNFLKFWKTTRLYHRDNSSFHNHMSGLKKLLFTGEFIKQDGRLKNSTLAPMNISFEKIKEAFLHSSHTGNLRVNHGEVTGNSRGRFTGNEPLQPHCSQGIQQNQTTGNNHYGKRLKGKAVIPNDHKAIETQSTEEWLCDYSTTSDY
nr:hypothetical protein [uncultured Amphritea sp.]